MSYNTSIVIDTGAEFPSEIEDVGNMTSNIGEMFYKAMPGPYYGGGRYSAHGEPEQDIGGLPGISGLSCKEATVIIRNGIEYMIINKKDMRKLNPKNGWGNYNDALKYLSKILEACLRHPKATLSVNW